MCSKRHTDSCSLSALQPCALSFCSCTSRCNFVLKFVSIPRQLSAAPDFAHSIDGRHVTRCATSRALLGVWLRGVLCVAVLRLRCAVAVLPSLSVTIFSLELPSKAHSFWRKPHITEITKVYPLASSPRRRPPGPSELPSQPRPAQNLLRP